jgi:hypothetical protein
MSFAVFKDNKLQLLTNPGLVLILVISIDGQIRSVSFFVNKWTNDKLPFAQ